MNAYYSNVVWRVNEGTVYYATHSQPYAATLSTSSMRFASRAPLEGYLPSLVEPANNKAVRKLYAKADGVRVNLALFLAERKQVADLLASTASRIYWAARALKRADLRTFANALSLSGTETRTVKQIFERVYKTPALERLPTHWLEFVFGWRPLLDDCFAAAELLAEQLNTSAEPEGVLRVNATEKQHMLYNDWDPSTLTGGVVLPKYDDRHRCKSRIVAHFRMEDEARNLLSKTGISNPALLAWELLPYSFVVDWLVPVGTYLESLTAMDGFRLTAGTISTSESATSQRTLTYGNFGPFSGAHIKTFATTGGVFAAQRRYTRQPTVDFPYVLRVRSPIGPNAIERFVTATSLLPGLFAAFDDSKAVGRNFARI